MKKIITFGTFDLLHQGHINILERAKSQGDYLIVGISTDRLNAKKGKLSIFPQEQRLSYISALKCVDAVFYEDSLEDKDIYIKEFGADLLIMGDDWEGKFDWVSCETKYLPRTKDISSTVIKTDIAERYKMKKVLFGDTYIRKHYDCALSIINEMTSRNIIPIFTTTKELPRGIDCDCIVYFNKPVSHPSSEYNSKPRVLIDHGASTLKWFLASQDRYCFFDKIITAGPDHVSSLTSFFPNDSSQSTKVKSAGFIKSSELFCEPKYSREEIAAICNLDKDKPIVLFAPTWYLSNNIDMKDAIQEISQIENQVTSLHPETVNLDVSKLNVVNNINGLTLELLKHADCVISDTSSTLFEAAALGKPTIQILLREYSDNNAVFYDLPFVAGTSDLFCAGWICKPDQIKGAVDRVIGGDVDILDFIRNMQLRVLTGTHIDKFSAGKIVDELERTNESSDLLRSTKESIEIYAKEGLRYVHRNMFFSKNRIISRGGGNYNRHHASNSAEAINAAFRSTDIVEIDLVKSLDGIIVANDGFESRYCLDKKFSEITTDHFLSLKYQNNLTTISIDDVLNLCRASGKSIVCDIKSTDSDYQFISSYIFELANNLNLLDQVVIQCYSVSDFMYINNLGFKRVILAVWKYFYLDPLGKQAKDFIDQCFSVNSSIVCGISIPHINKHMPCVSYKDPRFMELFKYWKRIYIHGSPIHLYPELLRNHLGIFADSFSHELEFKDYSQNFNWVDYLFLNPGLVSEGIDNQVSAVIHYHKYGKNEKRLSNFVIPSDFDWNRYLAFNPDLRKGGVSSVYSAKAHWSKFGKSENRKYI